MQILAKTNIDSFICGDATTLKMFHNLILVGHNKCQWNSRCHNVLCSWDMAWFIFNELLFIRLNPRVPVVQFQKERYPCFQLTELFHLRPESKRAHPIITGTSEKIAPITSDHIAFINVCVSIIGRFNFKNYQARAARVVGWIFILIRSKKIFSCHFPEKTKAYVKLWNMDTTIIFCHYFFLCCIFTLGMSILPVSTGLNFLHRVFNINRGQFCLTEGLKANSLKVNWPIYIATFTAPLHSCAESEYSCPPKQLIVWFWCCTMSIQAIVYVIRTVNWIFCRISASNSVHCLRAKNLRQCTKKAWFTISKTILTVKW